MKKCFLVLMLTLFAFAVHAVELYWKMNPGLYSNSMTVIGVVQLNGVEQNDPNLEVGVFCGDELRGSALPYYSNLVHKYIHEIMIYGESTCTLHFRLYDHNTQTESSAVCESTITFKVNDIIGDVFKPYAINFINSETGYTFSGSGSWTEPSNWIGKDGLPLTELPDFTNEDVVIDGTAYILKGESVTVKSLTINPKKVLEINSDASLKVTGKIDNNDDVNSLILNDGGQIFQTNENVKATFKKNITNPTVWGNTKTGWQFISSPIVNTTIASFISQDTDYDLYIWDGSADNQWVNYKSHSDDEDYEDYFSEYLNCENEYGYGYLASYGTTNIACFSGNLRTLDADGFDFDLNDCPQKTDFFLVWY